RQRSALLLRDRHERHVRKYFVQRTQVADGELAVKRRHVRQTDQPRQREMEIVDVEVNEIEFVVLVEYALEQGNVMRHGVFAVLVEAKRLLTARHKTGTGLRVAAGKQRNIVTHGHEFFCQIGNNTFGAAV